MKWFDRFRTSQSLVADFHKAFGVPVRKYPTILAVSAEEQLLRVELLQEELDELKEAILAQDLIGIADALADIEYINSGTANTFGINLKKIFLEVHRSNMTKLDENGKAVVRKDGKILKSSRYQPPKIREALLKQVGGEW